MIRGNQIGRIVEHGALAEERREKMNEYIITFSFPDRDDLPRMEERINADSKAIAEKELLEMINAKWDTEVLIEDTKRVNVLSRVNYKRII